MIAVKAAKSFLTTRPSHSLDILLTEKDKQQAQKLDSQLAPLKPYPKNLNVDLLAEDSKTFIPDLLSKIPKLAPSFFMIDPYGHPLTLPVISIGLVGNELVACCISAVIKRTVSRFGPNMLMMPATW